MRNILILLFLAIALFGCSNGSEEGPEEGAIDKESAEPHLLELRSVDVQVENKDVLLTAEVRTENEEIFYKVEQGEETLQAESSISLSDDNEWKAFQIEIELQEDVTEKEDAPIFVIYGKTENGEEVNPNYIPIDLKKEEVNG